MTIVSVPTAELKRTVGEMDQRNFADAYQLFKAPEGAGRVTLIRPFAVLSPKAMSAAITLPMGIAYLAAVLEKAGYPVGVVDALGMDIFRLSPSDCGRFSQQGATGEALLNAIPKDSKIIGVSMMFSQEWVLHRAFIQAVKKRFPNAVIVAGGEHPTALPDYVLRECPEIAHVVLGEGELTFLELVHDLATGGDGKSVPGTAHLDATGHYVENGLSKRIARIDDIPRPAWHLFDVEAYFNDNWTMGISLGRNMPILATRGCPYQCTFCSNPSMWTTRYKMRDVGDVVDEIEELVKTYNVQAIEFYDLTAIVKRDWTLAFCAELEKRGIKIAWQLPSGTRSEALDDETLAAMAKAGCRLLVYAPESGSEETLKIVKKKITLDKIGISIRSAIKAGLAVKINLVIGFPHERLGHVLKTLAYCVRTAFTGVEDVSMPIFTPYPGSALFREMLADGTIQKLDDDYIVSLTAMFDMTFPTSYCKQIPGWQLLVIRILGHALFYSLAYLSHPSRIWRLIKALRADKFRPNNVIEQRLFDLVARKRLTKKGLA
jgi:radical SAM superfamily enzyme YgiQ (UPF0313 family)